MQTKNNVAQKGKIPYEAPVMEVEKFVETDVIRTSGEGPLTEEQTTSFTQWSGSWD